MDYLLTPECGFGFGHTAEKIATRPVVEKMPKKVAVDDKSCLLSPVSQMYVQFTPRESASDGNGSAFKRPPPPTIRTEGPGDIAAIRLVLGAAFQSPLEGQLVDDLRRAARLTLSLVAQINEEIVGHVAFSPVTVGVDTRGIGLAPLAVLPSMQKTGVGTALAQAGIEECRRSGAGFIVVLGSPTYYSRFGFQPAAKWNLSDEYAGGEAFQAMELIPASIPDGGGLVRYAPEFVLFSR